MKKAVYSSPFNTANSDHQTQNNHFKKKLHSFMMLFIFSLISFTIFITKNSDRTLLFSYALDLVQIIGYGKAGYAEIVDNSLQCLVLLIAVIVMSVIRVPKARILLVRF